MKAQPGPYSQAWDGEWYDVSLKNHKEQCCSCKLIHRIESRIVPRGRGLGLQQRCWTDDRATKKARSRARTKKAGPTH